MSDNILKDRIKQILECGICLNTPFPKTAIRICQNGHFLCSTCSQFSKKACHVCRNEGKKIRLQILEDVVEVLDLGNDADLCRYCEWKSDKNTLRIHEQICLYKAILCPLQAHPNPLSNCEPERYPMGAIGQHFRHCCINKICALPFSNQSYFVSFFSHLYINVNDSTNGTLIINRSNFLEHITNFRPIRIMSPFLNYFLTHTVFFRRILNCEATYFFGIKMQLMEEFCSQIKFRISFSKNELFDQLVIQEDISPISQDSNPADFYVNPNLVKLTQAQANLCNSMHTFAFFSIEVLNFGEIATFYRDYFGFNNPYL